MPNWIKYTAITLIVIIVGYLYWKFDIEPARKKSANINQAVYPRFRAIEDHCIEYVNRRIVDQEELDKCKKVVEQGKWCNNNPDGCTAEDYYKELDAIGFSLPPFYNPTPTLIK